ncbi:MAG: hypothetical protein ACJ0QQ_08410 [Parvicellaceae bacterium]
MSVQLLKKFRNNRCWSDINIKEIKLLLDSEESIFNKMVGLSMKNEKNYSWRAAWLLSRTMTKNDPRCKPIVLKIIKSIPEKEAGHQRELLKIINKFNWTRKQEGFLFDICVKLWADIKVKSGTRYYAMEILLKISQKYPELKNEINYLFEDNFLKDLSPVIRSNILKKSIKKYNIGI